MKLKMDYEQKIIRWQELETKLTKQFVFLQFKRLLYLKTKGIERYNRKF
jgi:hypothetical protein